MFKGQPNLGLPELPKLLRFSLKVALGVFLFILLSNYQPSAGFPPVKSTKVQAQFVSEQVHTIETQTSPIQFQSMFPGYVSQGYSNYHPAVDIATGLGMPIKPIATGKVVSAGYDFFGYGLKVEIEHPSGYKSLYAHLGKIYVKEGQEISANNYIGEVGLTGRTSGPHTHLEVRKEGKTMDALVVLPEIRTYATEADFQPVGGQGFSNPIKTEQKETANTKTETRLEAVKKENTTLNIESYLALNPESKVNSSALSLKKLKLIE